MFLEDKFHNIWQGRIFWLERNANYWKNKSRDSVSGRWVWFEAQDFDFWKRTTLLNPASFSSDSKLVKQSRSPCPLTRSIQAGTSGSILCWQEGERVTPMRHISGQLEVEREIDIDWKWQIIGNSDPQDFQPTRNKPFTGSDLGLW